MSEETPIMRAIMLALSKVGARVFRNNVGVAKFTKAGKDYVVRYGLCNGSSDVIGFVPVKITADMVGSTVAVFLAVEVKDQARVTPEQKAFVAMVRERGGISGVAHSETEALALIP
jgi:hypothetical protein